MKRISSFLCLSTICLLLSACSQSRHFSYLSSKESDKDVLTKEAIFKDLESELKEINAVSTVENKSLNYKSQTKLIQFLEDENKSAPKTIVTSFENPVLPYEEETGLTLSELESMAVSQHPEIQQSLSTVNAARGQRHQVTRKYNPVAGYQAQEVGNEGKAGQQGVFYNQTFVTANQTWVE